MVVKSIERGSVTGSQMAGVCILFLPYVVIFTPRFRLWVIDLARKIYFHDSPRSEWNNAVDPYQPRRLRGYILSMILLGLPPALLWTDRTHGSYWWHFGQSFIYLSIPIIIALFRPYSRAPMDSYDIGIIFTLLLPSLLSIYTHSGFPDITFPLAKSWPRVSLLRQSAFNAAIIIFYVLRPLHDIGLGFDWAHWQHKQWVFLRLLCAMVAFTAIALPLGLAFDFFSRFKFDDDIWIGGVFRYLAIYFFIAVPIEFLFRGIVQNLVHARWDTEAELLSFQEVGDPYDESDEASPMRHKAKNSDDMDESDDVEKGKASMGSAAVNSAMIDSDEENESYPHASGGSGGNGGLDFLHQGFAAATGLWTHYIDGHGRGGSDGYDSAASNFSEYDGLLYAGGVDGLFKNDSWNTAELPVVWTLDQGFWKWFNFQNKRDWYALSLSAVFFAFVVVNYGHRNKLNVFGAYLITFWLAMCVGWLWRHMHACVLSALLSAFMMFVASTILTSNGKYCAKACGG